MAVRPRNVSLCATSLVLSHTCAHHSAETLVDVRFWPEADIGVVGGSGCLPEAEKSVVRANPKSAFEGAKSYTTIIVDSLRA